jgi:hypothetical protein
VDMEAEYRKLIADKGENAWLEAAKRAAAGKPSLLSKWELDGLKHELEQPTVAKAQGPMVDYPEYLAWKNFAVGAKVGRASRIWLQEAPGRDKLVARDLDNREVLQVKSIPADQINLWRTEQVFDSDGSAHPTRDMEIGYPAKIEQRPRPARPPAPGAQGPPFEDKEAESLPAAASLTNGRNIRWVDMTAVAQDSGDEVVQLCGRQVKTHRRSVTFNCLPKQLFIGGKLVVTVWTSDEIPGKLVRKTEDLFVPWRANMPGRRTVDETFIQEIAGFEPGTAVAGKASDEWTPPAVALGGPPQQPIAVSPSPVPLTRSPAQQPSSVTREPATPLARTPMDATSIQQHASLMRHYSPLIRRAVTARTQVRLIENRTPLPDDVKTAADAADVERQALLLAIQKHDSDAIEKNGKALEDHVTTMESFLQK